MRLQFLGTSAGVPTVNRNVSSVALSLVSEIGQVWLFDVGEGTQHRILGSSIKPRLIRRVFITHVHGDHLFGLPGLISSRGFQGGETGDVDVYGPPGVAEFVETALRVSATHLSFAVRCHEVSGGEVCVADGFRVTAVPLDHVVPCVGYRVEEEPRPGELLVDELLAAGVRPGPDFARLKAGETVEVDGRLVDGRDFLGPSRSGRVVAYTGDTRATPATVELARGADVLVHEATYGPEQAARADRFGHATSTQAAAIARAAGVQRLLLTHFSARYSPEAVDELVAQARTIFPATNAMSDLSEVDVPRRDPAE